MAPPPVTIPLLRLRIPTTRDFAGSYLSLFALARRVSGNTGPVEFAFGGCLFLAQNDVAYLGGLASLIKAEGRKVSFDLTEIQHDVRTNLAKNGFLGALGVQPSPHRGNTIPYRADEVLDKSSLVAYLSKDWLGKSWMDMPISVRGGVIGTVLEIYANAFEHSKSPVGVHSCGQYYPTRRKLSLTVVDFGVGIPTNVRSYAANPTLPADLALEWAFTRGATTLRKDLSRGLGLDILKDFVRNNGGELLIFSNDGWAAISQDSEVYRVNAQCPCNGTVVNITLRCDEPPHYLPSEGQFEMRNTHNV